MDTEPVTPKILIVDDDPSLRQTFEIFFSTSGLAVETAKDGEEGLAKARANKPSIILLDVMMPKMGGKEVLQQLKADPALKDIPVIIFTALVEDIEKQDMLALGANDYIVKTELEPDQLLEKIKQLIGVQ